MTRGLRRTLVWCGPAPLALLPTVAVLAHEQHHGAATAWSDFVKQASIVLMAPGMLCGFAFRSAAAMLGVAGICWYLLGVGLLGLVLAPRSERRVSRGLVYGSLLWLLLIAALGVMWSRADLD